MNSNVLSFAEYFRLTGATQEEIAARANVSRSAIAKYLAGIRVPRMTGGENSEMARLIRACEGRISADSFIRPQEAKPATRSREVA